MIIIILYSDGPDAKTFDCIENALDYLIGEEYDAEALIEYDGAGCASVFDGALLSSIMTSHIQDHYVELVNEKAMAAGYPR